MKVGADMGEMGSGDEGEAGGVSEGGWADLKPCLKRVTLKVVA